MSPTPASALSHLSLPGTTDPAVRALIDDLRASEARYRSLVTATSAIVWHADAGGRFDSNQPGWTAFTGQGPEQLAGAGWLAAIHPDDRARTLAAMAEALSAKSMYESEHRVQRADGEYLYMSVRAVPISGADGSIVEWVGLHTDIDQRKRAEQRLRLLDTMTQAARAADDPAAIMDVTTRLLGEHMGVTRCPYAVVEPDNDRFAILHNYLVPGAISTVGVYSLDLFGTRAVSDMRAGHTLTIRDVDKELLDFDGAEMFNAIECKAIICCPLVKEGRLVAMMAVHQDRPRNWTADEQRLVEEVVERSWAYIERVRAAEALREADRRKTEFLAILAHELRNPLAPVRNGLQVMRMAEGDLPTVRKVRDMMERQVTQMIHLVDDLLDISRITRGRLELKPERVELSSVVASAVETVMPQVEAGGHMLTVDVAAAGLPLYVDAVRIGQVIGNVLHNASKYTPNGGAIRLSAHRSGGDAVIAVSDNGIGVPAEALGAVFDMFAQVGDAVARAQGGLGIGLSLAQRLVEQHGGTIALESRGRNHGSTVTIRLPLAPGDAPTAAVAVPQADTLAHGGLRVLVVDDNADAADMLSALLGIVGHTSEVANDGEAALALAARFRPDVVFLDLGMPGMDGYEVARRLRQDRTLDGAVIVALTGWGDASDRARTREAGFDHHLIKPADLAAVEALLADIGRARG
ncbi:MAG: ATP-binding protein [Telluria sp.]